MSPSWIPEAFSLISGGVHSGLAADMLQPDQVSWLRNCSTRGGRVHGRRPWVNRMALPLGYYQGSEVFSATDKIIAVFSGRIFEINPVTMDYTEIGILPTRTKTSNTYVQVAVGSTVAIPVVSSAPFSVGDHIFVASAGFYTVDSVDSGVQITGKVVAGYMCAAVGVTIASGSAISFDHRRHVTAKNYFCETAGSIVIQDNFSRAVIYDGATCRFSESDEVPTGTVMGYANGRLAVAIGDGRHVRFGDIETAIHQSELKFSEATYLLGGGDIFFPTPAVSIDALPVMDTATGQGPLLVSTYDGALYSVKTNITQRDLWQSTDGFVSLVAPNFGAAGVNAVAAVNQDLWMRSADGVRSVRLAVSDLNAPGIAPVSANVTRKIGFETPGMVEDASMIYFDNRLFTTHTPLRFGLRNQHLGVAVLNFDQMSSIGAKSPPVWEGNWDGHRILQLVTLRVRVENRAFAICANSDNSCQLWEILPERGGNFKSLDEEDGTLSVLETRAFNSGAANQLKALRRLDLWVSNIQENTTIKVFFRTHDDGVWFLWDTFSLVTTAAPTPGTDRRFLARSRVSTYSPEDLFGSPDQWPFHVAHRFQIRLEWSGEMQVDYGVLYLEPVLTEPQVVENPDETVTTAPAIAGVTDQSNEFWYSFSDPPLSM